ncbi:beta,beta-carotene 15,15'-dioxygenase-like [Lampetra planeri]
MASLGRQHEQECPDAVELSVQGSVPGWLRGCLIRNGPGRHCVGPSCYQHWFDGLALLRKFRFCDGRVWFSSRYLQSDTYKKNVAANRIVVPEFGTRVELDPSLGLLEKSMTYLRNIMPDNTDNCLINVVRYGQDVYACTETTIMRRLDPDTLDTLDKVDMAKFLTATMMSAHPHYEADGSIVNICTAIADKGKTKYCLFTVPPTLPGDEPCAGLRGARHVLSVPSRQRLSPSYVHSFGLSARRAVLLETPHVMDVTRILSAYVRGACMASCLSFQPDGKTYIHVLDRSGSDRGAQAPQYYAGPMVVYHHANAYEDDEGQHLVVDVMAYSTDQLYSAFFFRGPNAVVGNTGGPPISCRGLRYVLPLGPRQGAELGSNLVTMSGTTAQALLQKKGKIECIPEELFPDIDLPCINPRYRGKKYRYLFAIQFDGAITSKRMVKLDLETRETRLWEADNGWCGEPVFVASPDASAEDDGVLLCVTASHDAARGVDIVVIDAREMKELGRARTPSLLPMDMHGIFIPDHSA